MSSFQKPRWVHRANNDRYHKIKLTFGIDRHEINDVIFGMVRDRENGEMKFRFSKAEVERRLRVELVKDGYNSSNGKRFMETDGFRISDIDQRRKVHDQWRKEAAEIGQKLYPKLYEKYEGKK